MARKRRSRLYVRHQGGQHRYHGNFRDFADVGGGREALRPRDAESATSDEKLAQMLLSRRLAELEDFRRKQERGVALRDVTLAEYVETHLKLKASAGTISPACLEAARLHLNTAVSFCGASLGEVRQRSAVVEYRLTGDPQGVGAT